jgi:hypothetical protein
MGLATPLLMLVLSAVIDFGRVFYYTDAAVGAARAGAQYGIQSAANFGNYAGMQLAAQTDAQGIQNFSATATSYCQDSAGTTVACTAAGAEGYVKVATSITYNLILSWPGLPNPLPVGAKAIMRCQ